MNRIYHPYYKWEETNTNMYGNTKNLQEESMIVVSHFRDLRKTQDAMLRVISEWKYSCEHNLTNISQNRIAWLVQSSITITYNICREVTMFAWNMLNEEEQENANKIAEKIIKMWEEEYAKKI